MRPAIASRKVPVIVTVCLAVMVLSQILGTPRGAGPDEPAHVIRAAGLVRGEVFGTSTESPAVRVFDVPEWVAQPEPCFAFNPEQPASCAASSSDGVPGRISTAGSYPPWAHLLPGLATLLPGSEATYWLSRMLHSLVPVALLAMLLTRLIRRGRILLAASVLLAMTPAVLFNIVVVNPSGVAIAGAIVVWVEGLMLARHDDPHQGLLIAGWAALVLPRNDGVIWALIIVVLLWLAAVAPPWALWARLRPRCRLIGGAVLLGGAAWATTSGTDLVATGTAPTGFNLVQAIVTRTGIHLREAVDLVGWFDTTGPDSTYVLWWLGAGVLVGVVAFAAHNRLLVAVIAALTTFVAVPWVFEFLRAHSAGLWWQGRYALPVFVGFVILAGSPRLGQGRRQTHAAVVVGAVACIAWIAAFAQQLRRWGVGASGSIFPWRWDTWSAPIPVVVLLVAFLLASIVLVWVVMARIATPRRPSSPESRPAGVNVIGYHQADNGLGDAVRAVSTGFEAAGVAVRRLDIDAEEVVAEVFRHTVTVGTAAESLRLQERYEPVIGGSHRVAGFWFWELDEVPDWYQPALVLVDEVWVASRFVHDAFAAATTKPVRSFHLPPPTKQSSGKRRADFGLPNDAYVFLTSFSYLSVVERKNPFDVILAFRAAFREGDNVKLVIKSITGDEVPDDRQRVLDAVGDHPNIVLIEETLPADDHMALLECCDCLVSLHRSEGYGLHLAEAMALGRPVIATRYSGNLDFMDDSCTALVDVRLIPVTNGLGAYPDGARWAQPDIAQAVIWMRRLAFEPGLGVELGFSGMLRIEGMPSPTQLGESMWAALNSGR